MAWDVDRGGGAGWTTSQLVLVAVGVVLVSAWSAVFLVDGLGILGLRERLLVDRGVELPYLYWHLFQDRGPVEWMQWGLLVAGSVAAAMAAGRTESRDPVLARATSLFALLLGVLAVKDAGSPRHVAREYAASWFGPIAEFGTELAFFGAVGLLAVVIFIRLWPVLPDDPRGRRLLAAGYTGYALAGAMSASSSWWYERGGLRALDAFLGGRIAFEGEVDGVGEGFGFMDGMVEESVELIAVGALTAFAFWLTAVTRPPVPGGSYGPQ